MTSASALAIYATVVSTAAALWALYRELFLDRPRVRLRVEREGAKLIKSRQRTLDGRTVQGQMIVRNLADGSDLARHAEQKGTPIVEVTIANRGRRPVEIRTLAATTGRRSFVVFGDTMSELPAVLEEGRSKVLVIAMAADDPLRRSRFSVVDGAGLVHPLRERHFQRITRFFGPR